MLVDVASEYAVEHRVVVEKVLEELGASPKKKILALNKSDLLAEAERARVQDRFPGGVLISAAVRQGLSDLIAAVREALA